MFDEKSHNALIGKLPPKLRLEYLQKILLSYEHYSISEKAVVIILKDMNFEDQINILEALYLSNAIDYRIMLGLKLNAGNLKDDQIINLIDNNNTLVMKFIMATYIKDDLLKLDVYKKLYKLDHFKFIDIALNSFESEQTKFKFVLLLLNYQDDLEYTIELLNRINLDTNFLENFVSENKEVGNNDTVKEAIIISKFDDSLKIKYYDTVEIKNDSNYSKLLLESLKFNDSSLNYEVFKEAAKENFYNKEFGIFENMNNDILKNYFNETEMYYLNERKKLKDSDKQLLDKYTNFEDLSNDRISFNLNIIEKVNNSNSLDIVKFGDELKPLLFENENPIEKINILEKVFENNNLPQGIKVYEVFQVLHPDFENFKGSANSKALNSGEASLNNKDRILLEDMMRISFLSSPKQGLDYLDEVQDQMNSLRKLLSIKNQGIKYEQLDDSKKRIVNGILNIVNSWSFIFKFQQETDLSVVYDYLNEDMISGIEDWIVNLIASSLGKDFKYLSEVKEYIINNTEQVNERNRDFSDFKLEEGDLVKGIGSDVEVLYKILQNGVNCKEFLGTTEKENSSLDVDFKMIEESNDDIENTMNKTSELSSGNLWIVIKNNEERFNTTGNLHDTRMELFKINGEDNNNYGIRSGVPATEIDYIICNEWNEKIGFAIATSEIYIPVVDKKGDLLFNYEDYENIRKTMSEEKEETLDEKDKII